MEQVKKQSESVAPPWHQSTEQLTSCPKMYTEVVIKKHRKPGGLEAERGKQVHEVGAKYFTHCALKKVPSDLAACDEFAAGAGPLAARILTGMRDSYQVDFSHFFAAELTLQLDADFNPTHTPIQLAEACDDSGLEPMVVGTLDALYAFFDELEIKITDLKTHARPFDPSETLQAQTYALLVFKHFAWVEKVTFELVFVRYRNVIRSVEFIREQVPQLIEVMKAARARQVQIHEDYDAGSEIKAIGNDNCFYCPLLHSRDCPILQDNPNAHGEPHEWVSSALVYSAYAKINNARMRALVQASGKPIVLKDFNGKNYIYGPEEKESEIYPVFDFRDGKLQERRMKGLPIMPMLPIIDLLFDYALDNPDDTEWLSKLTLSGTNLKRYLKANKRSFLDQAVEDTADRITKVVLRVSKPLDAIPDEEEQEEDGGLSTRPT